MCHLLSLAGLSVSARQSLKPAGSGGMMKIWQARSLAGGISIRGLLGGIQLPISAMSGGCQEKEGPCFIGAISLITSRQDGCPTGTPALAQDQEEDIKA